MKLALLTALLASALAPGGIPQGPTALAKLSTPRFRHHEVMRIDRDFGMEQWEIALDGWLPHDSSARIEELRLWWVNTDDGDRRKPFSAHLRRYIEFGWARGGNGALAVRMAGDRKEYAFEVELDAAGTPAVFANVTLADGTIVRRCRCQSGRLIARRVLGIPIGISALNVRCTDAGAQPREGTVPYRELERGRAYEPE